MGIMNREEGLTKMDIHQEPYAKVVCQQKLWWNDFFTFLRAVKATNEPSEISSKATATAGGSVRMLGANVGNHA